MKKIIIAACVAFSFISCDNNNETTKPEVSTNGTSEKNESTTEENTITIEPVSTNNTETSSTGKLNPPHGEPSHRCEIPVGAPLDSEPNKTVIDNSANNATNNSSSTTITPTFSNPNTTNTTQSFSAPASGKTTTAPGMNPPHGEPGHDCAIPVGAPLKK